MNLSALPIIDESLPNALRRARSALNFLADLKIAPTPTRFAVAYAHQLGEISELSLSMNRLIGHDRLTDKAVDELYEQFFGNYADRAELNYASQKVQDTVTDVTDQLAASRVRYENYGAQLHDFAQSLARGDTAFVAEKTAALIQETASVVEDQRKLEDRLSFTLRELDSLRGHLDRLERDASNDPLTGIGNRAYFNRELRTAMAHATRDNEPLCLMMIDIDHFKQFNDNYGHQMGDQVLKLVAHQLTTVAREGNRAARYGGEEFCLILRRCDLTIAAEIANRLRKMVAGKKVVNRRTGETLGHVTLSIGVALYRQGEPGAELIHRADEAMYLAKAEGRNRVVQDDHASMSV